MHHETLASRSADAPSHARSDLGSAGAVGKRTLVDMVDAAPAAGRAAPAAEGPSPAAARGAPTGERMDALFGPHAPAGEAGAGASGAPLESFEAIVAQAPGGSIPADLQSRFGAAHQVDLSAVRVHVVPSLAGHGIRGLSRGAQIALADAGDREALEHELGHVVDCLGAGGAPPNTSLDGLPLADDPAREARADQLAAMARSAPAGMQPPAGAPAPTGHAAAGAAMPKLTNRADIARVGNFDWASHKTKTTPNIGGGYTAEGLGAVLSSSTVLTHNATAQFGQLETLAMTIAPEYVDDSRPPLGAPPQHYAGHLGAYVLPSAMLGLALQNNLLYLPPAALAELTKIQTEMVALAKAAPGKLAVKTTFGKDGLADAITLTYQALDRVNAAAVRTVSWATALPPDRSTWGATPVANATAVGAAPGGAEWKTHVEWEGEHASGDGVGVVADKLGPDHQLGSAPSNATAKGRVTTLFNAAGKGEPYIAGHLLNDHLGGPGNLAANLAPIPKTANAQMSEAIEKPAKRIVNDERGWIRYEVKVTHGNDKGLDYPKRIDAKLGVYDASGTLRDVNSSVIKISRPSSYAKGKETAPEASRTLTGGARQRSPQMLDEVILTQENDLRPFLRDSAELFELVLGSELNPNVQSPKLAEAWRKVQEHLHEIEAIMLPDLNILSTVTDALQAWQRDAIAREYLATHSVGQLQQSLKKALFAGEIFAGNAMRYLTEANAVVKHTISPTDLFRDTRLLRLAQELVAEAPPQRSLLQLVLARQAQTVPLHSVNRNDAQKHGDNPKLNAENTFRDQFKQQEKPVHDHIPQSPVAFYEEYESSVQDVTQTAMYGATFESVRGPKALKRLHELALKGDTVALQALLSDPVLKTSKRIEAMVGQLLRFMIDNVWTSSVDMPLQLEKYFQSQEVTWLDTLEMLGEKEPKVAKQLYTLLGIT